MATGIRTADANTFLNAHAAAYPWIKLHTGDPGASGTANAATNTTRKQAAWAGASAGSIATNAELLWEAVAASEDYTHWSGWSLESGGTAGWSGTVTADAVTAGNNLRVAAGGLTYTMNAMA
jgi:hypothetical protein